MRSVRTLAALAAGCLTFVPAAFAEDLETQSFSAGSAACEDFAPDIAASEGGSFLLVWNRYCDAATGLEMAARPYDAEARPIGPEVNLGSAHSLSLAALPGGVYALAWVRPALAPFRSEIFLQRLDAHGRPIGAPRRVDPGAPQPSTVYSPRLAVDRAGRLAVLWQRQQSTPYRAEWLLRRFGTDLSPTTEVLSFADRPPYGPESADLAFADDDDLLVAWSQYLSEPTGQQHTSIYGRRYPAEGTEAGPSFRITTLGSGPQRAPRLNSAPRFGGWLMTWQSTDFLGKSESRFAYLPKSTVHLGQASGFSIEPSRQGFSEAAPAADAGAGILVLSESYDGPITRRLFDPLGFPVAEPAEVAPFGVWSVDGPAVSRSPTGSFLAVWAAAARVEFDIDIFTPQDWDLRGRIFRRNCPAGVDAACLLSERFGVQVQRGLGGATISARPTVLDDGSVVFAFPGRIPEVAVRMTQNGAEATLTYAATTNDALSISVTDRLTQRVTSATKPAGRFASGRIENLGEVAAPGLAEPSQSPAPVASAALPPLTLLDGRFRFEVRWTGTDGTVRSASGALFDDRRAAYRFGDDLSLTVSLIDGRASNGKFWVYLGGLSDAAYRVKVTDLSTGKVKVYANPAGKLSTRVDRQAF